MGAAFDQDRHRLTRAGYERIVESGVFDDERVELIHGEILDMSPIGPDHASAVDALTEILVTRLAGRATVRVQGALAIGDHSEPQPDLLVLRRGDYRSAHPSEAFLAIEVSRTSLRRDRGPKAALYAEAGIPEYWIVNLESKLVEVRREIVDGEYARTTPYRAGESISLAAFPDVAVSVDDIFGR